MVSALTSDEKGIYVELASIPTYSSARFLSEKVIRVTSAAKDHTRNVKRTSTRTLFVPSAVEDEVVASTPQDVSPEVRGTIISPSGRFAVILRETGDGLNQKRFVETWENGKLLVSEDVSKLHGAFYTDDYLRSLDFSPSETSVVYTAEANVPETSDDDPYARFRFTPDFGESLTGRKRPILVVFRWDPVSTVDAFGSLVKGVAKTLKAPEDISSVLFGQAVFSSDDHIIATGYKYTDDGQLLGVKGCWNRPADLWDLRLDSSAIASTDEDNTSSQTITISSWTKISDPERSSRSPRIYIDSSGLRTLFWLSNQLGGAHCSCTSLHSLVLQGSQQIKTLLDTIDKPAPSFMEGFPGLYTEYRLLERPFLHLGKDKKPFIVAQTAVGSRTAIILIDAQKPSNVICLTPVNDDAISSWSVFDTNGKDQLLSTRSSPTAPHELLVGTVALNDSETDSVVSWRVIDRPIISDPARKALGSLKVSIIQIPNRGPTETILIEHKANDNNGVKPLITSVHGGPHGTSFTSFTPSVTALALVGYTVSLPNYTGSLGFGDYYVKKLLGECGTLDVADVVESVRHLIELGIAEDNPKKLFVAGGSHGGFIGAHLVGQYPDLFGAAVLRNPVITGASPASTDIPDWYFWEFGIPYPPGTQATPDLYRKLWDMSPIAHAAKVKAPVLLHIGDSDRRVVNVQGKTFYHVLKARRVKTEMLEFKGEGHPLEGVEAARVSWESTVDWFKEAAA
ncbi:alpha/beta-hydrolase [Dentipellis sp. KUC8613]|nr:alpha/beta-hydrolase [Dentipellis sp. KUC8613]